MIALIYHLSMLNNYHVASLWHAQTDKQLYIYIWCQSELAEDLIKRRMPKKDKYSRF